MVGGRKDYQGSLPGRSALIVGDLKNRYELMKGRWEHHTYMCKPRHTNAWDVEVQSGSV